MKGEQKAIKQQEQQQPVDQNVAHKHTHTHTNLQQSNNPTYIYNERTCESNKTKQTKKRKQQALLYRLYVSKIIRTLYRFSLSLSLILLLSTSIQYLFFGKDFVHTIVLIVYDDDMSSCITGNLHFVLACVVQVNK